MKVNGDNDDSDVFSTLILIRFVKILDWILIDFML